MPHDDSYPRCNLSEMVEFLEQDPNTAIVWGPTQTISMDGEIKWIQREPNPAANPHWSFDIPILFNFDNYCNGALKGLFRRDLVVQHDLYIQPTYALQYSERCWLFAMSLLGKFHFMQSYQYQKRVYSSSTHAQWRPNIFNIFSQYLVMQEYLWRLSSGWRRILVGCVFLFILTCRKMLLVVMPADSVASRKSRINHIPSSWRTKMTIWIRRLVQEPHIENCRNTP